MGFLWFFNLSFVNQTFLIDQNSLKLRYYIYFVFYNLLNVFELLTRHFTNVRLVQ